MVGATNIVTSRAINDFITFVVFALYIFMISLQICPFTKPVQKNIKACKAIYYKALQAF